MMRGSFLHQVSLVSRQLLAFFSKLLVCLRSCACGILSPGGETFCKYVGLGFAPKFLLEPSKGTAPPRQRPVCRMTSWLAALLLLTIFIAESQGGTNSGHIALLLSGPEEAYAVSAKAFKAEVNMPVHTYTLTGEDQQFSTIKTRLFASRPSIIFALGAKAAFMAKTWTKSEPEIPVVFAMVLNWRRYNLLDGQANMSGIATETSVGTQFVHLTTIVPTTRKIGVVYSAEFSQSLIDEAKKIASLLGLELVTEAISSPIEFQRAYKKISSRIDSFWVLNDPVTFTLNNMDWLARRCIKDRIVCLGQSENVVRQGLTFAVNSDFHDIGAQAASLARNILRGNQRPQDIGVMDPLGTQIHINLLAAERIGLRIDPTALDMATKVFDK